MMVKKVRYNQSLVVNFVRSFVAHSVPQLYDMKKTVIFTLVAVVAVCAYIALSIHDTERTWQQEISQAYPLLQSEEKPTVRYSLSNSEIYPTYRVEFIVPYTGSEPDEKTVMARLIDSRNPKTQIVNNEPHKGSGSNRVFIGTWTRGFNAEGSLVLNYSVNPDYFRKVKNISTDTSVQLKAVEYQLVTFINS